MKTKVKTVLVLPDDPNMTEPMPVKICTDDGTLMSRRLEKLLEDEKVVYVNMDLAIELLNEIERAMNEITDWEAELIELVCPEDVDLLSSLITDVRDIAKKKTRSNNVNIVQLGLACYWLWNKEILRKINKIKLVKEYRKLLKSIAADH